MISSVHVRTRICVKKRARSISHTNVRSSNYLPWKFFRCLNSKTIGVVGNISRSKIPQTMVRTYMYVHTDMYMFVCTYIYVHM